MSDDWTQQIFAINGDKNPIGLGADSSSMSWDKGYNPTTSVGLPEGGIPIDRGQSNMIFFKIATALAAIQENGFLPWVSTYSYKVGAMVSYTEAGVIYQYRCRNNVNLGVAPGTNPNIWLNTTYFAPIPTSTSDVKIGDILFSPFNEAYALAQHPNFITLIGQTLSRSGEYQELFNVATSGGIIIPQADWDSTPNQRGNFGDGNGVDTFTAPDLRGYFIRNTDTNIAPLGTLQESMNKLHTHTVYSDGFTAATEGTEGTNAGKIGAESIITLSTEGGPEARPISAPFVYLMKYKNT